METVRKRRRLLQQLQEPARVVALNALLRPPKTYTRNWQRVHEIVCELAMVVHHRLGRADGDALLVVAECLRLIRRLQRQGDVLQPSVCAAACIYVAVHLSPVAVPADVSDWYGMYRQSEAAAVKAAVLGIMVRNFHDQHANIE